MKVTVALSVLLSLAPLLTAADRVESPMQPFPMDWQSAAASPATVAFMLDKPAGASGFVTAEGGHLVDGQGRRLRLWGINVTGEEGLPPRDQAPLIAGHLARCGINCVRFHMLDGTAPHGLIAADHDDTSHFSAEAFDRLDYFVAELKKQGIYSDLNLNVARRYKPGDGVQSAELLGFAKVLNYFDPGIQKLHRQYAADLLSHRNSYTGQEYRHEPAVALVEMVNENSIVEAWISGRLLGKGTQKNPGTWADIPEYYEIELTERYNAWLGQKVSPQELVEIRASAGVAAGAPVPRLSPRELAKADRARFFAEARFYVELERDYFAGMGRYLRDELHVQPLLVGTADHNHGQSGYPLLSSTAQLDVVDGHLYWQHPNYNVDPHTGRTIGFSIANTAMVDDPLHSTPVSLSRSAVAGKPYIVSEVNHPFPAEHECEGIPILAAYAAFQDWDGIFWYSLGHTPVVDASRKIGGHFEFCGDPVKMSQLAAGAMMFLRGDVAPARQTLGRSYSRQYVLESLRNFTSGFSLVVPLTHGLRITSFDAQASDIQAPPTSSPQAGVEPGALIRSDTGQIVWQAPRQHDGLVLIDTPRSQAIVGHCGGRPTSLTNLVGQIDSPFAAITLGSLDAQPISRAGHLLLTATARSANHAMRWNAARTSLEDWGQAPAEIEPVVGELSVRGLEGAVAVRFQPLDSAGRPLGAAIAARHAAEAWSISLGQPATTWYAIDVER